MNKLIVTYAGNVQTVSVEVETPLEISCHAEENVITVFEMADLIAELQFGKDFFEKFQIENVSMDFAK
jgi:hypothetical protein